VGLVYEPVGWNSTASSKPALSNAKRYFFSDDLVTIRILGSKIVS
jgi:hypothetical protein